MRIYKTITFILYPTILFYVYLNNPSIELLYILVSVIFTFLIINYTSQKTVKSINSFNYPNYLIELLLLTCYTLILTDVYNTISSIIQGEFFEIGLEIAQNRYSGESTISFKEQISSTLTFTLSLLLGLCNSERTKKRYFFLYIILLITSLAGLARASFIINIIFFASGILIKKSKEIHQMSSLKTISIFSSLFLLAFLIYAIPQYGRVYNKQDAVKIVLDKSSAYSTRIYFAFSEYIKNFPEFTETNEFKTFGIFSKIFGIEKIQGTYKMIKVSGGETNIFTFNRGLVEDFGFVLFPFILFIFYLSSIYSFSANSKIILVTTFWTIPFFLFPFISIFYFNNVFVGYLLFSIIILFSKPLYK